MAADGSPLAVGQFKTQFVEQDYRTLRMLTCILAAAPYSLAEVVEESGDADAVGRQSKAVVGHHIVVHLKRMGAHAALVAVVAVALGIEIALGLKGINNFVHSRTVNTPQKGDYSFFIGHHNLVVCTIYTDRLSNYYGGNVRNNF